MKRQLSERRSAAPRWVDRCFALLCKLDFARCEPAPQFCWSPQRKIGAELRVDYICDCGAASSIQDFVACLGDEVYVTGGDINETGKACDHLHECDDRLRPNA